MASTEFTSDLTTQRVLVFRAGATVFGCELTAVQEIIAARRPTRLPGAPRWIRGLINVRGAIVTVFDIAGRLEGAPAQGDAGFILLVRYRERVVGAFVDQVLDVRTVTEHPVPPAPTDGGAIRALGRTDDGMDVVLLDLDTLIQHVLLS